eukprot:849752-Karenia_brevis.AAC.1
MTSREDSYHLAECGRQLLSTANLYQGWQSVFFPSNKWCPSCKKCLPATPLRSVEQNECEEFKNLRGLPPKSFSSGVPRPNELKQNLTLSVRGCTK